MMNRFVTRSSQALQSPQSTQLTAYKPYHAAASRRPAAAEATVYIDDYSDDASSEAAAPIPLLHERPESAIGVQFEVDFQDLWHGKRRLAGKR